MLKKYALVIAIAYTIMITFLSFISLKGVPTLGIDYEDKIIHVIIYCLFALLWSCYLSSIKISSSIVIAVVMAVIYGIIIEVLQGSLSQSRQFDYYDILANTIGAILVIPIIRLFKADVKK